MTFSLVGEKIFRPCFVLRIEHNLGDRRVHSSPTGASVSSIRIRLNRTIVQEYLYLTLEIRSSSRDLQLPNHTDYHVQQVSGYRKFPQCLTCSLMAKW